MSAHAKVWADVKVAFEAAGGELSEDMAVRGERAVGNALSLQLRELAGADTSELSTAVASSFANLRAQGATLLVGVIRKTLRSALQRALLAAFGAIHPVAGAVVGAVGAALEQLDEDPE